MRRQSIAFAVILGMTWSPGLAGQRPLPSVDPSEEVRDSAELRDAAREAQAAFERRRTQLLPWAGFGVGSGSECVEVVGRFCVTSDGGDWRRPDDPPALDRARDHLLETLDSLQEEAPGDGWLLGQRVWYRGEAGRWAQALAVAKQCGEIEPWWCAALQGLAYHGAGRYPEAEEAFQHALGTMDPEQASAWREPRRALAGDARKLLDRATGAARVETLERIWTLADPLYLVPGNDRRTAHYARWTVSTLREGARNPFRLRWGRDLEELTLRHGWEVGWERVRGRGLAPGGDGVLSHDHPEGREFLPTANALREPALAPEEEFRPVRDRVRSLYAPDYAPVFLPMEGQVAVFPRGDSVVVLATHFLPEDTTRRPPGEGTRPWLEGGAQAGLPDRAGLFLVPVSVGGGAGGDRGGGAEGARSGWRSATMPRTDGVSILGAPAGAYVLSVEAYSPPSRRAGRLRRGLLYDSVPPDVPTLSDLLLVRDVGPDPRNLRDAASGVLLRPSISPEEEVAIVWEIHGLGWRPEIVTYDLVVERRGGGFLRGLGRRLGLVGRDRPLTLRWTEPGPGRPRLVFRRVALAFSRLEAGTYRVVLGAEIAGRAPLSSETTFEVVDGTR